MYTSRSQRGISLIELILFMVIVSAALAGLLSLMNVSTKGSVDPLMRKQALTIAESLLEEVELHDFSNPAVGGFTGPATQANRASFDDVMDYNGFATTGIYPADGSATVVPGLADYDVTVAVTNIAWGSIPAADAVQITVTVNYGGQAVEVVGYRVNY